MSTITSWTRNHRLPVFFALTFVISWWSWPFYEMGIAPTPFFACGPLIAALIVIGMTEGRSGYRALGSRMIRWRVGWIWWAVAIGMPLAVLAVATAANVGVWDASVPVDLAWAGIALNFAVRFVDPLDGPLGEEPGWRGYAVPQLQRSRTPLTSAVLLGVVVAAWHLPLVVAGRLGAIGLVGTFAITLVYSWLFNRTGGSVLLTMVFHVVQGTFSMAALGFVGADATRMDWLTGALWCLIAAGLVIGDRRAWRVAPLSATARQPAQPISS
jgi:membrane protease YdiL (CAAX protease family)